MIFMYRTLASFCLGWYLRIKWRSQLSQWPKFKSAKRFRWFNFTFCKYFTVSSINFDIKSYNPQM